MLAVSTSHNDRLLMSHPSSSLNDDSGAAKPPPFAARFFRPVRLAKFACLVGLSVFIPYLIPHIPNLTSRAEYRLETKKIQLKPALERPVPLDLIEQVRRQSELPHELSLLDPKLCKTVGDAFASHPWVARVISVRQSFPAEVVVELEFRRPVAMVQVKGGESPSMPSVLFCPAKTSLSQTFRDSRRSAWPGQGICRVTGAELTRRD